MTTMFEKNLECPACGTRLSVHVVGSCGQAGQDTDFRPHYWGADPLRHFIHSCPNCLFSGTEAHFQEPVSDELRTWLGEQRGLPRPETGSARFVLAGRCRARAGDDLVAVADLYLRGSWCARNDEDPDAERTCQQASREFFARALEAGGIPADEREPIAYLVGELHRRLGEFAEAMRCLEPLTEGSLGELAQRQLALARAGNSENAEM